VLSIIIQSGNLMKYRTRSYFLLHIIYKIVYLTLILFENELKKNTKLFNIKEKYNIRDNDYLFQMSKRLFILNKQTLVCSKRAIKNFFNLLFLKSYLERINVNKH